MLHRSLFRPLATGCSTQRNPSTTTYAGSTCARGVKTRLSVFFRPLAMRSRRRIRLTASELPFNPTAAEADKSGLRMRIGSNPVPLTSFDEGLAGSPKWSPDGQLIVFDARPGTSADIYSVPSAGGPVMRLTDYPGEDHNPSWSPDGKWIYFGSRRAGGHEVFRMHPDGSGVQQITHNGAVYGVVTPDGKRLYYGTRGHGCGRCRQMGENQVRYFRTTHYTSASALP